MSNTTIETSSGNLVDLANPDPQSIKLTDIIYALSNIPRYGGHSLTEIPYNVAQHSVMVMDISRAAHVPGTRLYDDFQNYLQIIGKVEYFNPELKATNLMISLIHDFTEAYLSDLPSPVKCLPGMREAYSAAESIMDAAICTSLDLSFTDEEIQSGAVVSKWADLVALRIEARTVARSKGAHWDLPVAHVTPDEDRYYFPRVMDSDEAFDSLYSNYWKLKVNMNA